MYYLAFQGYMKCICIMYGLIVLYKTSNYAYTDYVNINTQP